jgi:hypothetical protein
MMHQQRKAITTPLDEPLCRSSLPNTTKSASDLEIVIV